MPLTAKRFSRYVFQVRAWQQDPLLCSSNFVMLCLCCFSMFLIVSEERITYLYLSDPDLNPANYFSNLEKSSAHVSDSLNELGTKLCEIAQDSENFLEKNYSLLSNSIGIRKRKNRNICVCLELNSQNFRYLILNSYRMSSEPKL